MTSELSLKGGAELHKDPFSWFSILTGLWASSRKGQLLFAFFTLGPGMVLVNIW
jgi:hypothetical protein